MARLGAISDHRNWRKRTFRPAVAGLVCARPYNVRHAFVSLMVTEGRNVLDVAAEARHAPSMTFDADGHIIKELEGAERLPDRAGHPSRAREAGVRYMCDDRG